MRAALLLFLVAIEFFATEAWAERRVALVIGNADYVYVTPLKNPLNDAKIIAEALADSGFEVVTLTNLNQQAMKKALLEFGRKLKDGVDASVFYYAGHGVQTGGENYLVPTDADLLSEDEVDLQTVGVNNFLQVMENSRSKINIVIFDACRNNPFRSFRAAGGGLASVVAPQGTYIAYATAPGRVAADGKDGNSPYTSALVKAIRQPSAKLEDVFKKARELVLEATRNEQVPWESSSIVGDFYFKKALPVPLVAAPVKLQEVLRIPSQPVMSPASEWLIIENTNDKVLLNAFIERHSSDPVYKNLAISRLNAMTNLEPVATPKQQEKPNISAAPKLLKPIVPKTAAPPQVLTSIDPKSKLQQVTPSRKIAPKKKVTVEPAIKTIEKKKAPKAAPLRVSSPKPEPTQFSFRYWPLGTMGVNDKKSTVTQFGKLICLGGGNGPQRRCYWK